ncbi:MAG TPA: SDR family oxidoreductase [Patescibacteria group bacterium]|nr:SDR family oxidoreductase [Patescibacteria group bacterium]
MKLVVTGGAGFIGSHLVEALVELGEVTVVDNLSTGTLSNIQHLVDGGVRFEGFSVTDLGRLREVVQEADYVFHLAAVSDGPSSVDDPLLTNDVNVTGTMNVLLTSRDADVKRVIFTSSASVYGDNDELPISESFAPRPQTPYAASKITGEYYCNVFTGLYGLKTTCLRPFNAYGPRQNPDSPYSAVIPIFIQRLLRGEAPRIDWDGEQTRDFIYVKDLVRALILAMERDVGGVYNIASGGGISINELFRVIRDIIGAEVEPTHGDRRPGDIRESVADVSRAREHLGYEPEYDLRRGLEETIDWYRQQL